MRYAVDSPARIGRVLAYRRVSTRDQEVGGTSLDAQKAEIERYCAAHGLPSPLDFVEVESGGEESEEKRKEVARLLAGLRQGDAVIVSKIDRFARDMVFIVKNVRAIRKKGACFISLAECFDSRRPESDMMLGAWAMAADMERRRIQERTQGPRKRLRSQGFFVEGRQPFGYRRTSDGSRRLVIEPDEAKIIKEMFDLAANGLSILRIRAHMLAKYGESPGRRFGITWVSRGLRNRVYTGQLSKTPVRPNGRSRLLPGEWIDTHDPIVTPDLFAIVQKAIDTRLPGRKPDGQSRTAGYLMRGLARCSICKLTFAALAPSPRAHRPGYYICNRRLTISKGSAGCPDAPYMRQTTTDEVLTQQTVTFLKAITKALAHPPAPIKKPAFDTQRTAIRQKRDRVIKLVAENITTLEAAANTLHEIDVHLGLIDAAEAEHRASLSQDTAENRNGAKAYVVQVLDEWDALTIDVRRGIIKSLVREITIGKDKQLRIVWKDAAELAVDYAIGVLPALRVSAIKALPAPRARIADLLGGGVQHRAGAKVA
jgi:DNA invertase Pin-like site-specific DNA recombinase